MAKQLTAEELDLYMSMICAGALAFTFFQYMRLASKVDLSGPDFVDKITEAAKEQLKEGAPLHEAIERTPPGAAYEIVERVKEGESIPEAAYHEATEQTKETAARIRHILGW